MFEPIAATIVLVLLAVLALERDRRMRRAEKACEELKKQMMRGATVTRWYRRVQVPHSDPWYCHVRTSSGDLLMTDESFRVARQRARDLLK